MKLVVGLGNIGEKYKNTRHNIGFDVIDQLANCTENFHSLALIQKEHDIIYAKPTTFMNNSGQAVRKIMDYYKILPIDILIVHDDCQLDLGNLRLRETGSSGGHNGLKSIIAHLGTQDFARLKIGIGRCEQADLANFVLSTFKKPEDLLLRASDAVKLWISGGSEKVMQTFNKKNG